MREFKLNDHVKYRRISPAGKIETLVGTVIMNKDFGSFRSMGVDFGTIRPDDKMVYFEIFIKRSGHGNWNVKSGIDANLSFADDYETDQDESFHKTIETKYFVIKYDENSVDDAVITSLLSEYLKSVHVDELTNAMSTLVEKTIKTIVLEHFKAGINVSSEEYLVGVEKSIDNWRFEYLFRSGPAMG